jgi:hypothetical protein
MNRSVTAVGAVFLCATATVAQNANPDTEEGRQELAKEVQNPIASLISVPFQNNINFNNGPYGRVQNVLNVQPVVPEKLNDDWNLITRVIVPVAYQPQINTPTLGTSGFGDTTPTFFFSPARGKLIWGAGPVFLIPTATDSALGTGKWGAGPSVVLLMQPGHWTVGAVTNNIWSFAGNKDRPSVNSFYLQWFAARNFRKGWYVNSAPILTANWHAPRGAEEWIIPFGLGGGRVFKLGRQPVNTQIGLYYNVTRPEDIGYAHWQARFQIALLYPKAGPK